MSNLTIDLVSKSNGVLLITSFVFDWQFTHAVPAPMRNKKNSNKKKKRRFPCLTQLFLKSVIVRDKTAKNQYARVEVQHERG